MIDKIFYRKKTQTGDKGETRGGIEEQSSDPGKSDQENKLHQGPFGKRLSQNNSLIIPEAIILHTEIWGPLLVRKTNDCSF